MQLFRDSESGVAIRRRGASKACVRGTEQSQTMWWGRRSNGSGKWGCGSVEPHAVRGGSRYDGKMQGWYIPQFLQKCPSLPSAEWAARNAQYTGRRCGQPYGISWYTHGFDEESSQLRRYIIDSTEKEGCASLKLQHQEAIAAPPCVVSPTQALAATRNRPAAAAAPRRHRRPPQGGDGGGGNGGGCQGHCASHSAEVDGCHGKNR